MSESAMRQKVIKELRSLHAVAIENLTSSGVPDINCVAGWLELKWVRQLPVKASTPVRLPHFTDVQRHWLTTREKRGGHAYLLLQCKREWFLFTGTTAAQHVGHVTRDELEGLAIWYSNKGLNKEELKSCLLNRLNPTNNSCSGD